jgi:hypothetical protein
MDPEELYIRAGEIVATMPNLDADADLTQEAHMWFGRAGILVGQALNGLERVKFEGAAEGIQTGSFMRESDVGLVRALVYRALAYAESRAPVSVRGAFIPAGSPFTALASIGAVLKTATHDVFIVDPYMDETALMDFGPLVADRIKIRLLADKRTVQASLRSAVPRWIREHGDKRPLEAKLTPPRALHDRAIFVDGKGAWVLTQSLKDFATRSPGVIFKADQAVADLKIPAYEDLWKTANPL